MGNLSVLYGGIFQDMKSCKFSGARVGGLGNFRSYMVWNFHVLYGREFSVAEGYTYKKLDDGKFRTWEISGAVGWGIFRSWKG